MKIGGDDNDSIEKAVCSICGDPSAALLRWVDDKTLELTYKNNHSRIHIARCKTHHYTFKVIRGDYGLIVGSNKRMNLYARNEELCNPAWFKHPMDDFSSSESDSDESIGSLQKPHGID